MHALLITIGDEILLGNIVNSNAAFIGRELARHGIFIAENLTVGDKADAISHAIEQGMGRYEVVISTGGLGPTEDDITKNEIARYFGKSLTVHEPWLNRLRKRYEKANRTLGRRNRDQALIPEGAEVLENPNGTAPGLILEKGRRIFFALPGVPCEMKWLILNRVIPRLQDRASGSVIRHRMLLTTGIPESTVAKMLEPITRRNQEFSLAFLPSSIGVRLRLTVYHRPESEAVSILSDGEKCIRELVGHAMYGVDDETLSGIVGSALITQQKRIAVAESCTGGLIGHWLTETPGSSVYFDRAATTYSNQSKIDLLDVAPGTIEKYGAVSKETAQEMAAGIRKRSMADIGLSVTGIAGPTGGTPEKPIGLVYIGLSAADRETVDRFLFRGGRSEIKIRSAQAALDMVRKYLLLTSYDPNLP